MNVCEFPNLIKFLAKKSSKADPLSEEVVSRYFSQATTTFNLKVFLKICLTAMNEEMRLSSLNEGKKLLDLYTYGKCLLQIQLFLIER